MIITKNIYNSSARWIAIALMTVSSLIAYALPNKTFTTSSRLASGTWKRVEVSETGIYFISSTDLKSWGLDPAKTNVYGYGGREIPSSLNEDSYIDDLPKQPCLRNSEGITFFAVDNVSWTPTSSGRLRYTHNINRYSNHSYYFLSDSDPELLSPEPANDIIIPSQTVDKVLSSFQCRILHEKDLMPISNTGAIILGEDFRANNSQVFSFRLPDNIGENVELATSFGANISSGMASLIFSANGNKLPALQADNISPVASSDHFIRLGEAQRSLTGISDKLDLRIQFSSTGAITTARLNYIEINYTRKLKLQDGELYFYGDFSSFDNESTSSVVSVEGCDTNTIIWDVTNPADPKSIPFRLNGTKAEFGISEPGYREFIAFNRAQRSSRKVSDPVNVTNQNIHALPQPDMVIITLPEFRNASEKVADMHRRNDNMVVNVVTPQELYNEFSSGNVDVGAFRKALKMWYDRAPGDNPFRYCLLMGKPTNDNKNLRNSKEPKLPIWQSTTGTTQNSSFSTDDYIGMLQDCNIFNIESEKINVAVGRWPVKTTEEADAMAEKLINYVESPKYGAWRNDVLIIADDQDNAVHLDQAEKMFSRLSKAENGKNLFFEKLYLDSYPLSYSGTGPCYPDAKKRLLQKWNDGVLLINYIGHANTKSWTHESLLTWTDMNSFTNSNLPFLYAATCEFNRWDNDEEVSGAELIWLNPKGGVIGMICPSRSVYISQNGYLTNAMGETFFTPNANKKQKTVGEMYIDGKNGYPGSDDNKLRYGLMSDPALQLPVPQYKIEVTDLAGIDLNDSESAEPVIEACSKVEISGVIRDDSGNIDESYNGILSIALYDAEKVVETYGNGKNGVVKEFNAYKNRLFNGSAKVENGKWKTIIMTPIEIDNVFNKALISLYAYSEKGVEANGAFSDFYVYGYNKEANNDTTGPEIIDFRLNSKAFSNGSVVNSNPIMFVSLADESGINVSQSGIGHAITLTLDGNTHMSDIGEFFTPDPSDPTRGSITYPLSNLDGGEHTLQLTVWDYANNSSTATLDFHVGIGNDPIIIDITPNTSTARTDVVFTIDTDRPLSNLDCRFEIFDLSGKTIWESVSNEKTDIDSSMQVNWNLKDKTGKRVARGIYLYRATITTAEGTYTSKTKKLAVSAQ